MRLATLFLFCALSTAAQGFPFPGPGRVITSGPLAGWTYVQDTFTTCSTGTSTCSTGACGSAATTCTIPTVSGSVWVVFAAADSNPAVHISSVSGGSATWNLVASSKCYSGFVNTALGEADCAYALNGSSGTTNITVTMSGNFGGSFAVLEFMEMLPPATSTASLDDAETTNSTTCTPTCTGTALTLTATDGVFTFADVGGSITAYNAWSSPYQTTSSVGDGVALNITSGSAPTVTQTGTGGIFPAIAFKSSLGTFTAPTPVFSIVQQAFLSTSALAACNTTCNVTVSATGSNHLLFVAVATESSSSVISAVSDGTNSFTVPGANCNGSTTSPNTTTSCAYLLSSTSGKTTITVTMSPGSTTAGVGVWEFAKTSGNFSVDLGPSAANRTTSFTPLGISLGTLNAALELVAQCGTESGGMEGAQFYPIPRTPGTLFQAYAVNLASCSFLLNTTTAPQPLWAYPGTSSQPSSVFAISFK